MTHVDAFEAISTISTEPFVILIIVGDKDDMSGLPTYTMALRGYVDMLSNSFQEDISKDQIKLRVMHANDRNQDFFTLMNITYESTAAHLTLIYIDGSLILSIPSIEDVVEVKMKIAGCFQDFLFRQCDDVLKLSFKSDNSWKDSTASSLAPVGVVPIDPYSDFVSLVQKVKTTIGENEVDEFREFVNAISLYISNIVDDYHNGKKRKIRVGNSIFQKRIARFDPGLSVMLVLGFKLTIIDNEKYLTMINVDNKALLMKALSYLKLDGTNSNGSLSSSTPASLLGGMSNFAGLMQNPAIRNIANQVLANPETMNQLLGRQGNSALSSASSNAEEDKDMEEAIRLSLLESHRK